MHPATHLPPESANERTERHLRQLRRMADLAEILAEAAAARAQMALAELPPGPEQAGQPPSRLQRAPNPTKLFAQLASVLRQCINLERRIIAGHAAAMPKHTQADPRRAKIRRAIRQATTGRPDRAIRRQEADALLEAELALDPDGIASLPDLLETICQDVGFELNYDQLAADLAVPEPLPHPLELNWHQDRNLLL